MTRSGTANAATIVTRTAGNESRRWLLATISLLALHALLSWWLRPPAITTGHDDAIYLLLGRGLIHGSYRNFWLVGTPPHGMYPPLYPALLGLTGASGDHGLSLALALNVLLSVAMLATFAAMVWAWSAPLAVLSLAVLATNRTVIQFAGSVMSEPLFGLCLMATLLSARRNGRRAPVATGTFALAGALARSIGVTLVGALLLQWLIERRWRRAIVFVGVSTIVLGPWFGWSAAVPAQLAGESYWADAVHEYPTKPLATGPVAESTAVGPRPDGPEPAAAPREPVRTAPVQVAGPTEVIPNRLGARVVTNAKRYLTLSLGDMLSIDGVPGTPVDNVVALLIGLVLGAAGVVELWRRQPLALLSSAAYCAVLVVWPYRVTRFLVPLLPIVVLTLVAGARCLTARLAGWRGWALPGGIAALLTAFNLPVIVTDVRAMRRCERLHPFESPGCYGPRSRGFFSAAMDADRIAARDATFLSPKMATLFYLTGRRSVNERQAAALDADAIGSFLDSNRVDYILLSLVHEDQTTTAWRLRQECRRWVVLGSYDQGATVLLGRASARPGKDACDAIARLAAIPP